MLNFCLQLVQNCGPSYPYFEYHCLIVATGRAVKQIGHAAVGTDMYSVGEHAAGFERWSLANCVRADCCPFAAAAASFAAASTPSKPADSQAATSAWLI